MKLKVRQGTQVKHNGTLYKGGEEFTANDSDADSYIRQGWAEEVAKKAPAKRTGPTRAQSEAAAEDKATSPPEGRTVTRAEGKPLSPPEVEVTYTGEYEISTEDSFGSGTETPMRAIRVKTEGVHAIFPVTKEFAESSDEKIRAYLGARLPTILEQDEFDTVWMVD